MKNSYKAIMTFVLVSLYYFVSVTSVEATYGQSPKGAPVCNTSQPGQAALVNAYNLGNGQVELVWNATDKATSWTVGFGKEAGKYIYGAANFGNSQSRSIVISQLGVGPYFFALKANNGCMPGNFSQEVLVNVGRSGVAAYKSAAAPIKAKLVDSELQVEGTSTTMVAPTVIRLVPTNAPVEATKPVSKNLWQRIVEFVKSIF